ncbi:hypothetical protein BV25DRAFT_1831125 [Artomyces pyxidatus]|uniref:Uncharacterized protein n=1 Tax=Artomyces pyxidatus TaxID=48021 RepID=A0ACB8SNJ2_9AGAM|nr:hypothetical protein BV25DRAFT_1831125 [Artomyces pyxidatus]
MSSQAANSTRGLRGVVLGPIGLFSSLTALLTGARLAVCQPLPNPWKHNKRVHHPTRHIR